jgi:hypothetical protein
MKMVLIITVTFLFLIPFFWERIKRVLIRTGMALTHKEFLKRNSWINYRDVFDSSPVVSSRDFPAGQKLTVDFESINKSQFLIFDASPLLPTMKEVAHTTRKEVAKKGMDLLVSECMKHISSGDFINPIYVSCLRERGSYFPAIHNDTDWMLFPQSLGFQLWYLVENDATDGNMFMVNTPTMNPLVPNTYSINKDGSVSQYLDDQNVPNFPLNVYETFSACKFEFQYLGMKPGDCLISLPRTLHVSDPRPALDHRVVNRLAVNMRVLLLPKNENRVNFWKGHGFVRRGFPRHKLLSWRVGSDGKVPLERYYLSWL